MHSTHQPNRRHILATLLSVAGAGSAGEASAANWPIKPVRIIVGFPPGSSPDITARILIDPLSQALGQPVFVENHSGASGNIAADIVAKSTDDHTLGIVINGNLTSAKQLYPKLPYDPVTDFSLLSLLTTAPLVLVAQPSAPDGADFFVAAKRAGNEWNYGSVGNGSVAHLGMELLKLHQPGLKAEHIPFAGNPQVITAMLSGQIQLALVPPALAMPQVRSGKLKAIGLTSGRSTLVPEVPSLLEAGVKNFNLEVWNALLGPARLSADAQARLSREVPAVVEAAGTRQKLFMQGWQAIGSSPEGAKMRVAQEAAVLGNIIQTRGIKLE